MKIVIKYNSAWRNSFLDGSNDEELPKKGRKYIASVQKLNEKKKPENYIERNVTQNTVMGVLNRLIGDQRKLYQARKSEDYFFNDIESLISFEDRAEITEEVVYLRNKMGNCDPNDFTGAINGNHPLLTSEFSKALWSVIYLTEEQLFDFVINDRLPENMEVDLNPLVLLNRFKQNGKNKKIEDLATANKVVSVFAEHFPDVKCTSAKDEIILGILYILSVHLQVKRLSKTYDVVSALSKQGNISGVCKKSFSPKDFMGTFSNGGKKILGNPYVQTLRIKGQGEVKKTLRKANGELEININVDKEKAREIKELIENAGVNTFYLGKKGLAYVSKVVA